MRQMAPGEVVRMVDEQNDSMMDLCYIGAATEVSSTSGGLSTTYVDSMPTPCSLMAPKNTGVVMVDKNVVNYTALLRVAKNVVITVGDRITVIEQNGSPVNMVYYAVAPGTVYRTVTVYPLDRVVP